MFALTAAVLCFIDLSRAGQRVPEELRDVGIEENLGTTLPLDLRFTDETGSEVFLSQYFNGERPVILNLVYYECPNLCNLILNGLTGGLNQMEWVPGADFDILTVSIDPSEGPALAAAKKQGYLKALKKPMADDGWHFLTGDKENIRRLSHAVGFKYKAVENGEFAHSAALFLASPAGVLSRYLYGVEYSGFDLKRGLLDAMEGKTLSVMDKVIVFCYRYSKEANGYVLFARNFMKGSGFVVLTLVALLFGFLWLGELRKKKKKGIPVAAKIKEETV